MRGTKNRFPIAATILLGALLAVPAGGVAADAYPSKPIKLLVGFAAGGSSDVSARVFAKYAAQELKANIAVVNVAGAAGSIATKQAAKADPDGYTLLWHHPTIITAFHTGTQKFTWDSLTPIANVTRFYKALVVHKDSPWKTMADLLKDAKARPGQIKWGVNIGAGLHFEALGMEDVTGTKFRHVAGGGDSEQVKVLLGKQIDVASPSDTVVLQYIADGTFRALGTSGDTRLQSLPDIPTYKEQGVDYTFWYDVILYAPPGLPAELVTLWSDVARKVVDNPEAQADLRKLGMYPAWLNVEDTRALLLKTDAELYRFARRGGLIPASID